MRESWMHPGMRVWATFAGRPVPAKILRMEGDTAIVSEVETDRHEEVPASNLRRRR